MLLSFWLLFARRQCAHMLNALDVFGVEGPTMLSAACRLTLSAVILVTLQWPPPDEESIQRLAHTTWHRGSTNSVLPLSEQTKLPIPDYFKTHLEVHVHKPPWFSVRMLPIKWKPWWFAVVERGDVFLPSMKPEGRGTECGRVDLTWWLSVSGFA